MKYNAFSICLNSLHLPDKSNDGDVWCDISPESEDIIYTLYRKFQVDYSSARNPEQLEKKLNGSIFAVCISEGYVLLSVGTNKMSRTVNLSGFLLRSDESLRTAWKLVRWQLLFLCAKGWDRCGKVYLLPSEINDMASQMKFGQEEQKKLLGIGLEMLKAEIPYSFALTNYSRLEMPLEFKSGYELSAGQKADNMSRKIFIGTNDVQRQVQEIVRKQPFFQNFTLEHNTVKNYIKNYQGPDKDIKTTMSNYGRDEVWYFVLRSGDMVFQKHLDRDTSTFLSQEGGMEFSSIYTLALNTLHEASNYFTLRTMAQREQMQQQYAPQQRPTRPGNVMQDISPEAFNASQGKVPVTEAKKKKPEKSGGFLSRFRHKKDD